MFSRYLCTNSFASRVGDERVNMSEETGTHSLWDKNSILSHVPLFDFVSRIWKDFFHASTSEP